MNVDDRVEEAMADLWQAVVDHPLVLAIEDGSCPREVVRLWAKQKFCAQREFASNLAVLFSRMPPTDRDLRAGLAGNLYGERDHSQLFLDFAAGLGVGEQEMWASSPLPATAAFSDRIYRLVREGTMADVAAALHVGLEGVTIQHFPKIARGLRAHYGLDEKAIAFFTEHDEADADHFQHGIEVLAHYADDDLDVLDRALEAAGRVVHLYALSYREAWEARDGAA